MFSDKRITARRTIPRPAAASWQPLAGASTSMVSDGQGRRGAFDAGLRPVTSAVAFAGPALTVHCRPGDNLTALAAIEWIRPGDVVVLANGGHVGAALIGGNYAAMVKARGAVAVVCDAPARDLGELEAVGLPVFARGAMPAGPTKMAPGTIGFPVAVGPITVASGDLIIGDRDGLVLVRADEIAAVVAGYLAVRDREAAMAGSLASGALPDWLAELVERVGVDVVGD